jgi:RNA polymerase sigma-70 factor (ECF subfamily)
MGPQEASSNPSPNADDGAELAALARLAGSGDPVATRRFLDWIRPTLARVVNGVLGGGHADVDDVMQQSLLAVLQALGAFRGECHPAGYASRIALHVALHARRTAGLRLARTRSLMQLSASEVEVSCVESEVPSERRKRALRDLLIELPEEQAEALALRVMLGWSLDEVASASGAPVNTVRSRVRLAKDALRKRIEMDPSLTDDLEAGP